MTLNKYNDKHYSSVFVHIYTPTKLIKRSYLDEKHSPQKRQIEYDDVFRPRPRLNGFQTLNKKCIREMIDTIPQVEPVVMACDGMKSFQESRSVYDTLSVHRRSLHEMILVHERMWVHGSIDRSDAQTIEPMTAFPFPNANTKYRFLHLDIDTPSCQN